MHHIHRTYDKKFLVIQTASIGDVILSTAIGEKLNKHYPNAQIDYLVKQGNERLFDGNPWINEIFAWDKSKEKYKNMLRIIFQFREEKYDAVINLQRFASSGIFTIFSGAKKKYGFRKNPLSLFFSKAFPHKFKENWHETDRNHQLISKLTDGEKAKPALYPTMKEFAIMSQYKTKKYITITPASLWFTKQYPIEKWMEFITKINSDINIYLLGSAADRELCDTIVKQAKNNIMNLAGKLSFLESAALMRDAAMNYVNDSAAQHIASSVNAKITAIFCSTIPDFGFGPLSDDSVIIEAQEKLDCKPCGLHGHKTCPKGHFKCALNIDTKELLNRL
ncbi:MAG: glycosyltransferase family 9 protein [Bacteroidetes bacterium]|nr:MAG: glycosyltransferase family 9 protein [Bacteroidota bacterium]